MDLDIIQSTKEGEITQFLCDVRDYFKASLATSEYENTSNMFYLSAAEATEQLLQRCEQLLNRLSHNRQNSILSSSQAMSNQWYQRHNDNNTIAMQKQQLAYDRSSPISGGCNVINTNGMTSGIIEPHPHSQQQQQLQQPHQLPDDVSYLDMTAANNKDKTSDMLRSIDSDKTFRCSTLIVKQNKSFLHRLHDTMTSTSTAPTNEEAADESDAIDGGHLDDECEEDPQIYDICQVTTQGSDGEEDDLALEDMQRAFTSDTHFSLPHIECPYMDLPAGHLAIHKSSKYGQLQRIEKRLFFDQSKKCYCGILGDWLLCYADGPTSNKPSISLYLKIPGIEIEHFGEGKRRDVCFQISTPDPSKRFVFQAVNEIDAKEWIHAIEAAIRSDIGAAKLAAAARNSGSRKLPTPPVVKKMTFLSTFHKPTDSRAKANANANAMTTSAASSDCIYEEPSPLYQMQDDGKSSDMTAPPALPHKENSPSALAQRFDYDVPKCPPQPLQVKATDVSLINPYDNETTAPKTRSVEECSEPSNAFKANQKLEDKLHFQAKVKDVHNKLSSQLSNGPGLKKPLKKTLSSGSAGNDDESLIVSSSPKASSPFSDMKKQKKSITPQNSPQKATDKGSATKNWFLNRLNKTNSSTRSNASTTSNSSTPGKCKQSEKENLLGSADNCDGFDTNDSNLSSNPASPILKSCSASSAAANGKSKVNMIINQLEASGHLASMFTADAASKFGSFCDNDCNSYEPIMTVSSPPCSFMKKV